MAPKLSEEEIDDLIYLSRAGEDGELTQLLKELSGREQTGIADVLEAAQDESGATCLHMAAANGHSKTVTHILSHLPAPTPGTAAAAAAAPSSEEAGGEDKEGSAPQPPVAYINRANEFGNTALHWACLGGHLETVQLLLSRGASPALANAKDQIPLDMAAFNNHMAVVNYFLSQSKDLEGDNAADGGLDGAVKDVEVAEEAEEAK